jgi:hypothetical protein
MELRSSLQSKKYWVLIFNISASHRRKRTPYVFDVLSTFITKIKIVKAAYFLFVALHIEKLL